MDYKIKKLSWSWNRNDGKIMYRANGAGMTVYSVSECEDGSYDLFKGYEDGTETRIKNHCNSEDAKEHADFLNGQDINNLVSELDEWIVLVK